MKTFYLLPLMLLSACATQRKLTVRPQPLPTVATDSIRFPEVVHAYHLGRYADPNDDLILHEPHDLYRVEQSARWDLAVSGKHPTPPEQVSVILPLANDAIVAEVNYQKIATAQILGQARHLAGALTQVEMNLLEAKTNWQQEAGMRAVLSDVTQRLTALENLSGRTSATSVSPNHESADPLAP